ncbi:dethiobiotin synthase [Psychromonas ingrahamii 37]|uniref:ATP-dependent dethiobiotin synthetase BioD n=1 Tax=Psychromonas ingrahamii (strain DSM 17664 / CCUG 51855 / 37) TaxID=357804 RepID=A1SW28_PSYIN|nr:dethiobiotin synthase [Psychromonas ingrahamii]ABM03693.1 dethiobiotin synthase [Psychromonas ingrahamii 37]
MQPFLTPDIYFVTGTDTDVGKTVCCQALLQAANKQKLRTLAYKPIAAGCEQTPYGLRNHDAQLLQKTCNLEVAYKWVNPIAFTPAIAPHIAAQLENKPIEQSYISQGLERLKSLESDLIIVEGAGGWRLPLSADETLSDWVATQKLSVILVVGMKLGCLNHAILTYESILNDGLKVVGWIANQVEKNMPFYTLNIEMLKHKINAPMIAEIPYLHNINEQDLSSYVYFNFATNEMI